MENEDEIEGFDSLAGDKHVWNLPLLTVIDIFLKSDGHRLFYLHERNVCMFSEENQPK